MLEWKKLVSVSDVQYGYPFESSLFSEDSNNIPLIRIRDVKPAKASTYYSGEILEEYLITKGDILVGMDGEFNLGKWNDRDGLLNQRVLKLTGKRGICLDGYLFHYMGPIFKKIEKQTAGGSVKHLSAKVINAILIPVPSIAEQTRIVSILDTFTAAIDNLKQQIAQRRKQYEHYCDQLLDLEGKEGVEMKTLGEVCNKISAGKNKEKNKAGQYPVFGSTGIIAYSNSYVYDTSHILVARVGANAGFVHESYGKYDVTDNTLIVIVKDNICQKYVFYLLVRENINKYAKGGGQPLITASLLKNIAIPVPSLAEQRRIVSILDTFEQSIANLEQQLAQREKQYEYYRNKLLKFN